MIEHDLEGSFRVFMTTPDTRSAGTTTNPDNIRIIWWTPTWSQVFPPHHRSLRFLIWWIFDRLGVFKNGNYAVAVVEDRNQKFITRVCIFPAWWQVPFMAGNSVQLGDIFTVEDWRRKQVAQATVAYCLAKLATIDGPIYYVARSNNTASHALARSCRFRFIGDASKSRHNFLGRYKFSAVQAKQFSGVTEIAGEPITKHQILRLIQRYMWAMPYCRGRDVLDVACGSGAGIGLFASVANLVCAGDLDPSILLRPVQHYEGRAQFCRMDAMTLPFADQSFDIIVIFEAVYYLPDARAFFQECRRVLRPRGALLLSTANKDLYDFNRSPLSTKYLNAPIMAELLASVGFSPNFFGGDPVREMNLHDKVLRLLKFLAARLRIIPGTMKGKRWIKQIVFGALQPMPAELKGDEARYEAPIPISSARPDTRHHFIYCAAHVAANAETPER